MLLITFITLVCIENAVGNMVRRGKSPPVVCIVSLSYVTGVFILLNLYYIMSLD